MIGFTVEMDCLGMSAFIERMACRVVLRGRSLQAEP